MSSSYRSMETSSASGQCRQRTWSESQLSSQQNNCDTFAKRPRHHLERCAGRGDDGNLSEVLLTGFESWWTETHLIDFLSYAMERKNLICYSGTPITSCDIFRSKQTAYVQLRCPAEAENVLRFLCDTEVNGVTLKIRPWTGTQHWQTPEEDGHGMSSDDKNGYYEEYKTGRRLLIWSVRSPQWTKTWLKNDLNQEMRRYGTENAVVDLYKDGSRWVIKVVNADLAMKLRKKLYYTRKWWVYGFDAEGGLSEGSQALQTSTFPNHRFVHPSFNKPTNKDGRRVLSSLPGESQGARDAGAGAPPPQPDITSANGGTCGQSASPAPQSSPSEGELTDMEESGAEPLNTLASSTTQRSGKTSRTDTSVKKESSQTVTAITPRNEPKTGGKTCPISLLDGEEEKDPPVNKPAPAKEHQQSSSTSPSVSTQQDNVDIAGANPPLKPILEACHQPKVTPTPTISPGKNAAHLLHHVEKLAEQAKQEAEQNRLRKELGHVTSQLLKQLERVKELELNNQSLTQRANEGQRLLTAQQAAAESAIQEMKRAKAEASEAVAKLNTVQEQLDVVHNDWQDQFQQIKELELQLLAKQNALQAKKDELAKERSLREDTEHRYRDVTESLTLQTNELARERRARQQLEQFLVKRQNA